MEFTMEIDNTNPRKRCRDEPLDDESELGLHLLFERANHHHVAKRARHQSDADASPRDSAPASPSESSGPSTPASIDVDMELDEVPLPRLHVPAAPPAPAPELEQKTQPRPQQGTIISGWNQASRNRYLNQGYPLSWMQRSTQN